FQPVFQVTKLDEKQVEFRTQVVPGPRLRHLGVVQLPLERGEEEERVPATARLGDLPFLVAVKRRHRRLINRVYSFLVAHIERRPQVNEVAEVEYSHLSPDDVNVVFPD